MFGKTAISTKNREIENLIKIIIFITYSKNYRLKMIQYD